MVSELVPKGDQPKAIEYLSNQVLEGRKQQVLVGVTGSGKTFTMAHVVNRVQRPTLVIAPNKTLAAQLYAEFKALFPENAVEYFVSYYDYYQPEAYIPSSDTYIAKDASINEAIDQMRHSATHSLLSRRDVIIVASVSCIYGLGSPEVYHGMVLSLEQDMEKAREEVTGNLVEIQYLRNDYDFHRGTFRVRGDVLEVFPAYEEDRAVRVNFFGDTVESIQEIDPLRGKVLKTLRRINMYPASHYVAPKGTLERAVYDIRSELKKRIEFFVSRNQLIEAQRIKERTNFDIEMLRELGYCNGIENYSRHLDGRKPGVPPPTLIDYFPRDFLLFTDESHVAIPQLEGMYIGDRSRKEKLVEYGFRLPSALDNRPLTFEEFESRINQVIYVSATPAEYELTKVNKRVVEQIIRPTGLTDPRITVKPARNQVDDLLNEIRLRVNRGERVLVTTLTKRTAEDLTEYYTDLGLKVRYLHSDVGTIERVEIIRDLRLGTFDVLIGINLLREGLDIPEVSLVAILDADKEGFLRSERSLIQTSGRAARNVSGEVILYADKVTTSIQRAVEETRRRRAIQEEFNRAHGITPETIKKSIGDILSSVYEADYYTVPVVKEPEAIYKTADFPRVIRRLKREMKQAAKELEFEKAAGIRDRIRDLEKMALARF